MKENILQLKLGFVFPKPVDIMHEAEICYCSDKNTC